MKYLRLVREQLFLHFIGDDWILDVVDSTHGLESYTLLKKKNRYQQIRDFIMSPCHDVSVVNIMQVVVFW